MEGGQLPYAYVQHVRIGHKPATGRQPSSSSHMLPARSANLFDSRQRLASHSALSVACCSTHFHQLAHQTSSQHRLPPSRSQCPALQLCSCLQCTWGTSSLPWPAGGHPTTEGRAAVDGLSVTRCSVPGLAWPVSSSSEPSAMHAYRIQAVHKSHQGCTDKLTDRAGRQLGHWPGHNLP